LKKRLREIARKKEGIIGYKSDKDSDSEDGIHDDSVTLAGRKKVVQNKPDYVKKIIRLWIEKARSNMGGRIEEMWKLKDGRDNRNMVRVLRKKKTETSFKDSGDE
jgi:hypothetical protein